MRQKQSRLARAIYCDMRLRVTRRGRQVEIWHHHTGLPESPYHKHAVANAQSNFLILNNNITLLAFSLDTRLSAGCEMVAQRMPAK